MTVSVSSRIFFNLVSAQLVTTKWTDGTLNDPLVNTTLVIQMVARKNLKWRVQWIQANRTIGGWLNGNAGLISLSSSVVTTF